MNFNPSVSLFQSVKSTHSSSIPFLDVLQRNLPNYTEHEKNILAYRHGEISKEQREDLIPAYTPSGVVGKRRVLLNPSLLLGMDIDKKIANVDHLEREIASNELTFAVMKSISGRGLVVFVRIDRPASRQNHPRIVDAAAAELGLCEHLDPGGKAQTQPRFLSLTSTDELFINHDSRIYEFADVQPEPEIQEYSTEHIDIPVKIVTEIMSRWLDGRWLNHANVRKLWAGSVKRYTDEKSRNEADLALCRHLAWYLLDAHGVVLPYYLNKLNLGDPGASLGLIIDGCFRHSKLMRPKWAIRHDYRQRTIGRAIALVQEEGGYDYTKANGYNPLTEQVLDVLQQHKQPLTLRQIRIKINRTTREVDNEIQRLLYAHKIREIRSRKTQNKRNILRYTLAG
ncbi:MAG: hypothetical protein OXP71_09110 [Candidatus Poribacteria bacterium]|nr:hypothetical protein [Candidatus Poribacteria bacterium]